MIFYKRITICNLFAYYGEQNVEFTLSQGKPIYLLFGRNGFGKTSFIRSVKLLFAGSGMLDVGENVPEVVLNFTGTRSRGVFTPRVLLLGQNSENGWRGAFNRRALSNDENKFYIELALDEDEREIIIRREWSRFPDLCEKLIFIKDGERLENNQAREEIERILPLNFLQFFVFDGEEIEAMADEVSTELKDKIQSMLNIAVLDRLSDQINKAERELISQSNTASKIKSDLDLCEGRQKSEEERLQNAKINIKFYEAQVSDKSAAITAKKKELEGKIRSNSKESEGLQNAKDVAMANLQRAKQSIAEFGGEILFAGLDEFFLELLSRIEKSSDTSGFNKESLTKLAKFSADYLLREKIGFKCDAIDLNTYLRDAFLEFIKNNDGEFKGINKSTIPIVYSAAKENSVKLLDAVRDAKNAKSDISRISRNLDDLISDSSVDTELASLNEEIEALEVEKLEASENLRKNIEQKTNSEKHISELEIEIAALKDKAARDLRIKKKLNLLSEIKTQIITYKSGRITRTGERLKDKILSNYKHLISEDNVADIKIDNFIVKFIDASGEAIAVRSQSAGQKQIAAISIFWALSKLSDRCLPLIIDPPLARLDASNRKNVIQNYYANASNQVIVLPTDTEFSQRELEFASGKIAGIYDITNDKDSRDSASIKPRRE